MDVVVDDVAVDVFELELLSSFDNTGNEPDETDDKGEEEEEELEGSEEIFERIDPAVTGD